MGARPEVDQACPVCGTPIQDEELCPACRWRLRGDPVLGELTEQDVRRARAAVQAAGHGWDLRAAWLAAGGADPGTAAVLRGGPPRPGEQPPADPVGLPGGLPDGLPDGAPVPQAERWQRALEDLAGGRCREMLFVEFAPETLAVVRAGVDGSGIPRRTEAASTEWHTVVPGLDGRAEIRRFQLAGGIGTLPPIDRREFDAAVRRWLSDHIPSSGEPDLVLLARHPGWVLLDRAAACVRARYTLRAEVDRAAVGPSAASTAEAVRDLLRTAPLAVDHTLLLAGVEHPTGSVRAQGRVLFPAGFRLRPGQTATAEITVHGGVTDRAPVLLPVLAGSPASDGTGAAALATWQIDLPALDPVRLTFVLRGPGELALTAPGGSAPAEPAPDLPALVTRPSRRIVRPPRLEVFCTVELSGAGAAETLERLAFVRDLITSLSRQPGSGHGLRVGVVGHYDHVIHENRYTRRSTLLPPVAAGSARDALAALADWQPAQREQDTVSSLEDALKAVVPLAAAPTADRERVQRIVLVVARRPPALPRQHGMVPSCPLGADWRVELDRLHAAGARVMTRADPAGDARLPGRSGAAVQRYADRAWSALGADGSFRPGTDSAVDVAKALSPPWRLDGPPCRLALATPLL